LCSSLCFHSPYRNPKKLSIVTFAVMQTPTRWEAITMAYTELSPASSWPSTTTGPPSTSSLDCEGSKTAAYIENVFFHLSPEATLGGTISSPIALSSNHISSQAKTFVPDVTATASPTALPRTRVSSRVKAFAAGGDDIAFFPHSWRHQETMGAGVATYNEQEQEAVYLQVASIATAKNTAYDERLQEEVYLMGGGPSRTPSPVRFHWASTPMPSSNAIMQNHGFSLNVAPLTNGGQQPQPQQWQEQQQQDQQDRQMPVKRTFIHYEDLPKPSTDGMAGTMKSRSASAPSILVSRWFQLSEKAVAHQRGQCRPCAYFFYKEDGCRQAAACKFCHICPHGEIRRRKREKREQRKLHKAKAVGTMDIGGENMDLLPASVSARSC